MINFKNELAHILKKSIDNMVTDNDLTVKSITESFEYPPNQNMGDIAFPCFKLSKLLRKAPQQIAADLAAIISAETTSVNKVEAAGGYVNFHVSNEYLTKVYAEISTKADRYGSPENGHGKTVVLDYSSPNVAKPFHIGHLGTTIIGHSLKKLHQFAGFDCVGINYLGDWGTQFGKLILAYRMWGDAAEIERVGIDKLVELYVRINNEAKDDESLLDKSRAEFKKLEDGDEENLKLWKWFIEISLAEYKKTYKQLDIEFDSYLGESFYTDKMPAQVQLLRDKGLLEIDDGASLVRLDQFGMPPALILKRDGSTLYPTRDIAAAVYRKETYNFDKSIYVTSNGQSLHFAQFFKVIELMGYDWSDKLVHVPYGTVSINGEKLATRTGNVILLKNLIAMAIEKVEQVISEKNPNLENKQKIAEEVGVSAIVFSYLYNTRTRDINYILEDALSFEGNTGPYAQYTYARTCSILSKSGEKLQKDVMNITSADEANLIKTLSRFPEKVEQAIAEYEPSVITRYIIEVCSAFNRFYHNCQILNAENEEIKTTRINLTAVANQVLGTAFDLVCIKKTEKI